MAMSLSDALELISKANEEERKEKYYRWWLALYPLYTKETYESFEEFYEKYRPEIVEYDTRSKDEIMEEILEISGRRNK